MEGDPSPAMVGGPSMRGLPLRNMEPGMEGDPSPAMVGGPSMRGHPLRNMDPGMVGGPNMRSLPVRNMDLGTPAGQNPGTEGGLNRSTGLGTDGRSSPSMEVGMGGSRVMARREEAMEEGLSMRGQFMEKSLPGDPAMVGKMRNMRGQLMAGAAMMMRMMILVTSMAMVAMKKAMAAKNMEMTAPTMMTMRERNITATSTITTRIMTMNEWSICS
uniref:Uncharacterized protein At5g39570 n=1 Tax=Rhizophora mucronata TaxID=61149 RepID=A0A2P2JJU9_RHIMU